MIDCLTVRNGAAERLIAEAVSAVLLLPYAEFAVAATRRTEPDPATRLHHVVLLVETLNGRARDGHIERIAMVPLTGVMPFAPALGVVLGTTSDDRACTIGHVDSNPVGRPRDVAASPGHLFAILRCAALIRCCE